MEFAVHGHVRVVLPHVEDELRQVPVFPSSGKLTDFEFTGREVRQLASADSRLRGGRMIGVVAERVAFDHVRLDSMIIENTAWMSADLVDCALNRVVFRHCKILGARITDTKFSDVVFEDCRIEYADLDSIQRAGPIVFTRSVFNEVTFGRCELTDCVMTDCELRSVRFEGGEYADLDVRGTDLTGVRGAANLSGVLVTPDQRHQLAEAMVNELDLRYPGDEQ
ncbi:pentapeptide repeat-containing protein [Kribbella karoonensis]|uniref:Pentapeptide repeat protein n=1 Tax=Kribbella karoonensis TaxID=324851 RepID=A0ABN2DM55_9ACTN